MSAGGPGVIARTRSVRSNLLATGWRWVVLWAMLVAIALATRPLLPIDETRYLSVAWEMWHRGEWLVPYLNGSPYSDKPPLLFWGMLLGWRVFGVNQWWPRLLPPLFGLLSVFLLARLARRLSSDIPDAGDRPLPFLSGALWVSYSTVVLFDTLLTACVLLALTGLVDASRGRTSRGWGACAAGIGLGLLTKGPVLLVHVLPTALLAPWWSQGHVHPAKGARWRHWYLGLLLAVALGAALALAWALAAGVRGGPAYRRAILWDQTAGRVSHAFAHRRPWWWYLQLFPLILFPWTLWPAWWRSLAGKFRRPRGLSARFALAWVVPGWIILSLISGKQIHYLIPLLPGFALLAVGAGRRAVRLSLVIPALLILAHVVGRDTLTRYDLRPTARALSRAESSGRPMAYVGHYSGEFHFLGRLRHPIDPITQSQLPSWAAQHLSGVVIRQARSPSDTARAIFHQRYRDGVLGIWEAGVLARGGSP